jgi:hypothetical protein
MWLVGFLNLSYVGPDTNATIESYYETLKAKLKLGKNILVCHHVDWCIHELIGNILT